MSLNVTENALKLDINITIDHSLSLSFLTAIFPGEPGLAGFISAKDDGSGGNNWSCKTCKAPVKCHHQHIAPCGLRGCKNGPAPFPGRMSYKATKPGLVFVLYLSMFLLC